jgi:two-component sensor histidine kinase
MKSYLTKLCASISDSMISDPRELRLRVVADETQMGAVASVSMGLMVTELIINSLKHAYPEGRQGAITVGFWGTEHGWRLSVGDDGVGMRAGGVSAHAGLGTSIVNALAKQLKAEVLVTDAHPGTLVSIVHEGADATDAELDEIAV